MRFDLLQHNWALNKTGVTQVSLGNSYEREKPMQKALAVNGFLIKCFVWKWELFYETFIKIVGLLHDP